MTKRRDSVTIMSMKDQFTYNDAGVSIDAGQESIRRIKVAVESTYNPSVLHGIGPFGSLLDLSDILKDYRYPVLVQSIDSVGTKLMIARMVNNHTTIGMDILAHGVNDILCQGAKPVTFLDYIAVDKLEPGHIEQIVKGIVAGCKETGMPLVGGEIAELPGIYCPGQYDLVGSITGIVERERIITGKKISPGDQLVGLASNGLHTNGYSLVRKIFFELKGYKVDRYIPELGITLGEELMKPHRNYGPAIIAMLDEIEIKGIAHITGGGLIDNLPRILPNGCEALIYSDSWEEPPIFQLIQKDGKVPWEDMYRTFNMGIGMVLVVSKREISALQDHLIQQWGLQNYLIGEIIAGERRVRL
jgi:phosphoribosylformylglycinamidine cyclo-ligase